MKRITFSCLLALLLLLWNATASIAAKGEVVYYKSGCDYFIVETSGGYALLECVKGA
jgi:hypothetical protein